MKLAQLGEFGLIERIRKASSPGPDVRLGIGDDCAATILPPGHLLLTTSDLLIEEVHFRREWTDLEALGSKSVAVNVSDIAAMGGTPRHLYLGLGIPDSISVEDLDRFIAGFLAAAESYGAALVGGDTCRSPGPLFISVTVEGAVPEAELVGRGGARPGDGIFVSGALGDSALALWQLQNGESPPENLARRHHRPRARIELGRALAAAGLARAMIDLSDGLLADLGHILAASGVGARVEEACLPLSAEFRRACEVDEKLSGLALTGGEDYELLFTVAAESESGLAEISNRLELPLTRVGTITPREGGLILRDRNGDESVPNVTGFSHFGKQAIARCR